jgi:hypothetical protein
MDAYLNNICVHVAVVGPVEGAGALVKRKVECKDRIDQRHVVCVQEHILFKRCQQLQICISELITSERISRK